MSQAVQDICELLESYSGRDKVVRLACYLCKLWGSITKNDGLLKASGKLTSTRMTLRLFDDIPMLMHTLHYGFGSHEEETTSSILGVVGNVVDQLFLPMEKICWMADTGMLKLKPDVAQKFDTINTSLWAMSLYISLLKSIKHLRKLSNSRDTSKSHAIKHRLEIVTSIKLCIDIVHAVNCFPSGLLWGSKLDGVQVGTIATISSLIGIGLYFSKKRLL